MRNHPQHDPTIDRIAGCVSKGMLCAPLVTDAGTCVGVLQLINKHKRHEDDCTETAAFSDSDCGVFEHFAMLVTAAVANGER